MGSSPGFVSTPSYSTPSSDSVSLRLRLFTALTLQQRVTRWLILQKARRHALLHRAMALRPLVSVRFQILFHSPHRGSFHLSLTVLVRYRSALVFSLGQWSAQLPTGLACPVVLRIPNRSPGVFAYGTFTLFG